MGQEATEVATRGLTGRGVFVNTFRHKLDGKKRLTIPSDWREVVGTPQCVIVMPDSSEPCLCVYPARDMERRMAAMRGPEKDPLRARQSARRLGSVSNLLPWDGQGRIRISDELLRLAGLKEDVVLVGAFELFELWSPEKWNEQTQSGPQSNLGEAAAYVGF